MYRDGELKACKELEGTKNSSINQKISRSSLLTGNGLGEVTGEREIQRIHDENIDRLQSIDEKEILAEKEKLLNTLGRMNKKIFLSTKHNSFSMFSVDPKLVAFIRKRNKMEIEDVPQMNEKSTLPKSNVDNRTTSINLPIEVDSRWLHMDNIEYEKLEWMQDLLKPTAQRTANDSVRETTFRQIDTTKANCCM